MKIREIKEKAETLEEQGESAEKQRDACQRRVANANADFQKAQSQLDAARETDDDGNPKGDIAQAESRVAVAQANLSAARGALRRATDKVEEIKKKKVETIREIDQYTETEEKNLSKLQMLQGKRFGGNADAFVAALVSRMNTGQDAKALLQKSLGQGTSVKHYSASATSNTGIAGGAMPPQHEREQEAPAYLPMNIQMFAQSSDEDSQPVKVLRYGRSNTGRSKGGSASRIQELNTDLAALEVTYQEKYKALYDQQRAVENNNQYSEEQKRLRLQEIDQTLVELRKDHILEQKSILDEIILLENVDGYDVDDEYIEGFSPSTIESSGNTESLFRHNSKRQNGSSTDKWNRDYMPLVKANIRRSVDRYFSNYVSQEKMEKCLETLGFMDQAELRRRYEEGGRHMPKSVLGYNDGSSSNIASDMKGSTKDGRVGDLKIQGSGSTSINFAFVTAVHENLHMMSANDQPLERRRGLMVGNDEKSRAMNEAFTEYFTFLSCGGEDSLGGLYPGEYSGYQILMQEMPTIESAVGRDCMMDSYFNNNPQQIRSAIDSILEPGAWDGICAASYDVMYNDNAHGGSGRLLDYLNRLRSINC